MKALLMHADHDFDPGQPLPPHAPVLQQDLAVDTVVAAMADDDTFIAGIATNALLNGPGTDPADLRYRQAAVRDAVTHARTVRVLYAIATGALEDRRKSYWGFTTQHPSSMLYSALRLLALFVDRLRALRRIAEKQADGFDSAAFRNLFAMLQRELDDAYLARVDAHLEELKFADGALLSARLGPDAESEDYTLRRPRDPHPNWLRSLLAKHAASPYTVRVAERDLTGAKTLEAMRDRGIRDVAAAVAESTAHVEGFFNTLRAELAFHVGCANLHARLAARHIETCFPEITSGEAGAGFRARGLRDAALALTTDATIVGNDLDATGKALVVVTGANQGGKSTFLRSLGLAQLMLHAGMFVAAKSFASAPCTGLFTHYKREEDAAMQHGKLDEELARLGAIADAIRPGAWLLCNESFASTNEREGSELGRQMLEAMRERHVRVAFVTHLYRLAHRLWAQHRDDALFLRAERLDDGARTFRLREGAPRETSHGDDLYREVFGDEGQTDAAPSQPSGKAIDPAGAAIGRRA
ncbi:MAG: MutS-related protein [Rhodanobacteraceae bacterium]